MVVSASLIIAIAKYSYLHCGSLVHLFSGTVYEYTFWPLEKYAVLPRTAADFDTDCISSGAGCPCLHVSFMGPDGCSPASYPPCAVGTYSNSSKHFVNRNGNLFYSNLPCSFSKVEVISVPSSLGLCFGVSTSSWRFRTSNCSL